MWEHREAIYVAFLMICFFITYNKFTKEKFRKDKLKFREERRSFEIERNEFNHILMENLTAEEDNNILRKTFEENQKIYNELIVKYNELAEKYNRLNANNKIASENARKISQYIDELEDKKKQLESTMYDRILECKTEGEKRRKSMQDAWENQIKTGNCPENITLRDANRSTFFVTVSETSQSDTYASMKFGSAVDALAFAESLRGFFECPITVSQVSERGEYQVFLEGAAYEKIRHHYNARTEKFEFMNPVYDGTAENYRAITDEQSTILRLSDGGKYSTGEEYEKYVAERLTAAGYINIQLTSKSNDYGADLICEKSGIKYSVQCKMYSNPVGVSAVQEVNSSLAHYNCDKGMVITTNIFTSQARKLAGENGITLMENFT